ncbi:GLPGLI family protein [Flavobacterium cyclinae]|uniref:GLPGLI family protein n=1 Tax=Flavobacterium cyclinae TaxID=2895947 RepID=UPI001E5E83D4|nr:GLPGLI family protein [Flavobacterium cyclinae]UGS21056.1 GLPGLI family protein [Flavobacterium cyclinae]
MKNIIILSFVLIPFYVLSQKNIATYEVLFKVENQKRSSEFFDQITEASKNLEYQLLFNSNISQFSISRKLQLEGMYLAASKIISKGIYYYNKSENKNYIINDGVYYKQKTTSNWKLHDEQKIINNYKCFKATTVKTIVNSKGTFNHTITAWYCPEIPYSYGPNGYQGLPGLIFELIELPANHFVLKKLILNHSTENFIDLSNFKEISEESYIESIKSNLPFKK